MSQFNNSIVNRWGLLLLCLAVCCRLPPVSSSGGDSAGASAGAGSCAAADCAAAAGISFSPPVLQYADSPVCIPTISEFALHNEMDQDVHVYSIASDSSQFHPVSFQPQVLLPMDSLSIQLLFLPYHVQATEAVLTISTSVGDFEYSIIGRATSNPYNIHPFIGNKVIAGVPFEQPIVMLNPHDSVLHIREIFTTEEFLSLHRTGAGDTDAADGRSEEQYDPGSWELEAGDEREVIRLAMSSTVPGHYYGYVHVKTDRDKIVIPVDLQVLEGGLRAVESLLDFGVFTKSNAQKALELKLVNSGSSDVTVLDVVPAVHDPQLAVEMRATLVRAGMEEVVAILVYNGGKPGKVANKVLVTTDNTNAAYATLEVPYEASMLQGGIGFNFNQSVFAVPIWNQTKVAAEQMDAFQKGSAGYLLREVVFTNFFSVPVSLQGISAATCKNVINVIAIPTVVSANRLEAWSPVVLLFNVSNAIITSISKEGLPFTCWLELWTNISSHRIPLHVLDGDLNVKLLNDKAVQRRGPGSKRRSAAPAVARDNFDIYDIDFKTMSLNMPEGLLFSFENINPQRVPLYLANTTGPICLCVEAMLPSDSVGKNPSQTFETLFPSKFIPPKSAADANCSCYDSSSSSFSQIKLRPEKADSNTVFRSAFGALLQTNNLEQDEELAAFQPSGRGDESSELSDKHGVSFLRLKAGHTAFVSLHLLGLQKGIGSNVINITSPYQSKVFTVNYSVVDGDIQLKTEESDQGGVSFAMGRYQHIEVRARSEFDFPLPIRSLVVSSPHFSVPAELSLPNLPARVQRPPADRDNDLSLDDLSPPVQSSFVMIGGLIPDFSCIPDTTAARVRSNDMNSSQRAGLTSMMETAPQRRKYPVWGCIRKVLSMANVAGQRVQEGVGLPGTHDIGFALDALDRVEQSLSANKWSAAHDASLSLAEEWEKLYPDGFSFRPFNVTVATDTSLSAAVVKNISLVLHSESTPPAAEIILPPSTIFEASEFYIKVVNPFDVYVSFSLGDDSSASSLGSGTSPTASPTVAPTMAVSDTVAKEGSHFVPAMFPKTWVPSGCRRYSSFKDSLTTLREPPTSQAVQAVVASAKEIAAGSAGLQALLEQMVELTTMLVQIDNALNRNKITSVKILMSNHQLPKSVVIEEGQKQVKLLKEKFIVLESVSELMEMIPAEQEGPIGLDLHKFRLYVTRALERKETLRSAEIDLEAFTRHYIDKAYDSKAETKKPGDAKRAAKTFNGGGIVDPKNEESATTGISSAGTAPKNSNVDAPAPPADFTAVLSLVERSVRYKYSSVDAHQPLFDDLEGYDCHSMSHGWCGFPDLQTEIFQYPAVCDKWASSAVAPASFSAIVTGAVVKRKSISSKKIEARSNPLLVNDPWISSPFEITHKFPKELVLAPHTTAYLGPIKFESSFDGIFQKTVYVVNNYTGTDRVHLIAETGSSMLLLNRADYFSNRTTDMQSKSFQEFSNSWDPSLPFGSVPILVNDGEASVGVIAKNIEGFTAAKRLTDLGNENKLVISDSSGTISYTFDNKGILSAVITDIEINEIRVCDPGSTALYTHLCAALPVQIDMNTSWTVNIPINVDCAFVNSEIEIRLISERSPGKILYQTTHSTMLSTDMVSYCLDKRDVRFSDCALLRFIKVAALLAASMNFFFFWRKFMNNTPLVKKDLNVEGEYIYGGVSEVFLKHAHSEMINSSQRGRKATAIGSASAPDKKKASKYLEANKIAGSAAIASRSNAESGAVSFEDLVRADEIDISDLTLPVSSALQGYESFCKRRESAVLKPDSKAKPSDDPALVDTNVSPGELVGAAQGAKVSALQTSPSPDVGTGPKPSSKTSSYKAANATSDLKNGNRNPKASLTDNKSWSDQRGYGSVKIANPPKNVPAPSQKILANDGQPTKLVPPALDKPEMPLKAKSPKAPPGLTVLNSNQNWGESTSFSSPTEGDLDFDPADFNTLIDQDLRALLVKPGSSSDTRLLSASAAPPGFSRSPMLESQSSNSHLGGSTHMPKLSLGERNISNSNFQERFIDDLLLDDMSPMAMDPNFKSFFSGLSDSNFDSLKSRTGNDIFSLYGDESSKPSTESTDHFSSIMHLLDTESLPLSLSSVSSPAGPSSTSSNSQRVDNFSPSKFGGVIANSLKGEFSAGGGTAGPNAGRTGNLAASLTRPGDLSPGNPSASTRSSGGSSSKFSVPKPYGYPPLTLDTSVPPARVPEKSSGGRYPKSSPTSANGLPLAAALPPMVGLPRTSGSSPRMTPSSGPPGLSNVLDQRSVAAPTGPKSKLAADIRSTGMGGASGSMSGPALHGPPGLPAPQHRLSSVEAEEDSFFGRGSFFDRRGSSKSSLLSDDAMLQPLTGDKDA